MIFSVCTECLTLASCTVLSTVALWYIKTCHDRLCTGKLTHSAVVAARSEFIPVTYSITCILYLHYTSGVCKPSCCLYRDTRPCMFGEMHRQSFNMILSQKFGLIHFMSVSARYRLYRRLVTDLSPHHALVY